MLARLREQNHYCARQSITYSIKSPIFFFFGQNVSILLAVVLMQKKVHISFYKWPGCPRIQLLFSEPFFSFLLLCFHSVVNALPWTDGLAFPFVDVVLVTAHPSQAAVWRGKDTPLNLVNCMYVANFTLHGSLSMMFVLAYNCRGPLGGLVTSQWR